MHTQNRNDDSKTKSFALIKKQQQQLQTSIPISHDVLKCLNNFGRKTINSSKNTYVLIKDHYVNLFIIFFRQLIENGKQISECVDLSFLNFGLICQNWISAWLYNTIKSKVVFLMPVCISRCIIMHLICLQRRLFQVSYYIIKMLARFVWIVGFKLNAQSSLLILAILSTGQ